MGATMETVSIEGAALEFDDQGSGEPVVLIHGSGPADSFLPLALEPPHLAGRERLDRLVPERLGHDRHGSLCHGSTGPPR